MFHGGQRRLVNVCAKNVPTRSEAGLIEDYRSLGIGDHAVTIADHEAAEGLANVDPVIAVSSMAHSFYQARLD